MKIRSFHSKNLNGHLNFEELAFDPVVNFLIGINGSGKTSILRAIMGLLAPDIDWLMGTEFDFVRVVFELDGHTGMVSSRKGKDGKTIQYQFGDRRQSTTISHQLYRRMAREIEEYEYDEDGDPIFMREAATIPPEQTAVFQSIREIPAPLFLGLDRTTLPRPAEGAGRLRRHRPLRRPRPTLRTFLDEGVAQAEALAFEARRTAELQRATRADRLREDILLTLFQYSASQGSPIDIPKQNDIKRLEQTRRSLKTAFNFIGIDDARTSASIDPFFSEVIDSATSLSGRSMSELIREQSPHRDALYKWISFTPRMEIIRHVEGLVNKFNEDAKMLFEQVNSYADLINSFFADSRKTLGFDPSGDVMVRLPSGESGTPYLLSSGERQLFVLITALMFNEDEKQANVLIIDEPELSLHVKWQEGFVDGLRSADPTAQLILATHSPSIILDRDNFCIDLS